MLMMIVPVHYQDLEPAQMFVARANSLVFDHRTDLIIECSRDLDRNGGDWNARIPGESRGNGSREGSHWEGNKTRDVCRTKTHSTCNAVISVPPAVKP